MKKEPDYELHWKLKQLNFNTIKQLNNKSNLPIHS